MKSHASFRVYRCTVEDIQKSNILALNQLLASNFADIERTEDFTDELKKNRAADPFASSWNKWGFSRADWFYDEDMVHLANNVLRFQAEKRERLLPGDVLRKAIKDEADALQAKQEEPLNKKQWAEIKDVVVARLLPNSHIVSRVFPVLMWRSGNNVLLVIFSSSAKVCEDVQSLLRKAFGGWPFQPFSNIYSWPLAGFMTGILRSEYKHFEAINTVTLTHPDEGTVTYKDQDLTVNNQPLQEHLDGSYTAKKLGLAFHANGDKTGDDYTSMKLDAKGGFSGWKVSDLKEVETREYGTDGACEQMEGSDLIFTRDVSSMIYQIDKAMKAIDDAANTKESAAEESEFDRITREGSVAMFTGAGDQEQNDDEEDDENFL